MSSDIGYEKGDVCGREGCAGIIDQHPTDKCCSCHINPPCSYCTDSREYCPECGWEGSEEQYNGYGNTSPAQIAAYKKSAEEFTEKRESFYRKFKGKEEVTELEMRNEPHTHFTQKIVGIFPKGTQTKETVLPEVKGSFGGRFLFFGETSFEYIAYTD